MSAFSRTASVRLSTLALLFCLARPLPLRAVPRYWRNAVGSGNWSTPADWSNISASGAGTTDGGAPAFNDPVQIENSDGISHTVTLDVSTPTLGLVTINQSAGSAVDTLSITNNLASHAMFVSGYANGAATTGLNQGAVIQSAGTVTMTDQSDLAVGFGAGSVGTYTLSGTGTFVAPQSEDIGYGGNGTFNQSGGTNTISPGTVGAFDVGVLAGSNGAYTISGTGQLSSSKLEIIGDKGTGVFTQSGGTNTLSGTSNLDLGFGTTGNGTYTASGNAILNVGGVMNVGFASTGAGTLNVQGNASVNITDALNIGALDAVNLSGGTLRFNNYSRNSSGTFNFTGGTVKLGASRLLNLDATISDIYGATPTIANGRNLTIEGTSTIGTSAGGTVTVNGATFTTLGDLVIGEFHHDIGTLNITNGAHVTSATLNMANDDSTTPTRGTLSVSGVGTTLTTGNLNVDAGIGAISITGGASVTTNDFVVGLNETVNGSTVLVSGVGTNLTSRMLNLGNGYDHPITFNINSGAFVNLQQDLIVSQNSVLTLNSGTLHFSHLHYDGGVFQYTAGTIGLTGDRIIGTDVDMTPLFGVLPTINAGKGLSVDGIATISSGLTINGGSFSANSLVVNGPFQFSGGTFEITGGTISGIVDLGIPTNGEFRARGTQGVRVAGAAGSRITSTGTLKLGIAGAVNGFATQGTLDVGANDVTLLDANDVVFDSTSLVTIGSGPILGTLTAANGLTLNFGGNITGYGTITTPNDSTRPTIINGHVTGANSLQKITMNGYVKGVGTFDNVNFTGTFSPGLSPTTSQVGSVGLSSTSTLLMEIGGTTAGSQYDQLIASGQLSLSGTLQLTLINGFAPSVGQSFNLFDWQSLAGSFSSLSLPALGGGLTWNTSQLYATGMVSVVGAGPLPGDFNSDGKVDAADYVAWRAGVLVASTPANYNLWRANFGAHAGSGTLAGVAVPEPTVCAFLVSILGCLPLRRRARYPGVCRV